MGRLNIAYWISETRRILRLTRKPKKSEFQETARVCAIGIILLGVMGFTVFLISRII
ncbi:MAG TPA: protein translocase SEC61 complex subunit gamma [Candidatus Altiarchaeales archaeon]|nr:protein translocase SEC61 complex subunit gamma [Candidatus Altiarchaeales archaeon]